MAPVCEVSWRIDVSLRIDVSVLLIPVSIRVAPVVSGLGVTAPAAVSEVPALLLVPLLHAATSNTAATSVMYLMFRSSSEWLWAEGPALGASVARFGPGRRRRAIRL